MSDCPAVETLLPDRVAFVKATVTVEATHEELRAVSHRLDTANRALDRVLFILGRQSSVTVTQLRQSIDLDLIARGAHLLAQLGDASGLLGRASQRLLDAENDANRVWITVATQREALRSARARLAEIVAEVLARLPQGVQSGRASGAAALPVHWNTPIPAAPPAAVLAEPATALRIGEWGLWAGMANRARETITAGVTRWRELGDERDEAQRVLAVALSGVTAELAARGRSAAARNGPVSGGLSARHSRHARAAAASFGELSRPLPGGLGDPRLTAEQRARRWAEIAPEGAELAVFVRRHKYQLARLSGIPSEIRAQASREVLDRAQSHPREAYFALGLAGSTTTLERFRKEISALARITSAPRRGVSRPAPTLLHLGSHRGRVTAMVAVGDVHTARRVSVVVPGMFSNVENMGGLVAGAQNIYAAQEPSRRGDTAVIAWMGYRSPGLFTEPRLTHARLGGLRLGEDVHALQQRGAEWIGTVGHSYGSTTIAEALKLLSQPIDSFVTVGSAGLAGGTTADQLQTRSVAGTSADPSLATPRPAWWLPLPVPTALNLLHAMQNSDAVAPFGRVFGQHPVDPRSLAGALTVPNVPAHSDGVSVGQHGIWTPKNDPRPGYLSAGTPGTEAAAARLDGRCDPENERDNQSRVGYCRERSKLNN